MEMIINDDADNEVSDIVGLRNVFQLETKFTRRQRATNLCHDRADVTLLFSHFPHRAAIIFLAKPANSLNEPSLPLYGWVRLVRTISYRSTKGRSNNNCFFFIKISADRKCSIVVIDAFDVPKVFGYRLFICSARVRLRYRIKNLLWLFDLIFFFNLVVIWLAIRFEHSIIFTSSINRCFTMASWLYSSVRK